MWGVKKLSILYAYVILERILIYLFSELKKKHRYIIQKIKKKILPIRIKHVALKKEKNND